MICSHCGYELDKDSRVCKHCGEVVWKCWHCGHETGCEDHFCKHCGKVFWVKTLEAGLGRFFAFAICGLVFSPLFEARLRRLPTGISIVVFAGTCAGISLAIIVHEVISAWKISGSYTECDAAPPRHDCPDWKYPSQDSCIQVGNCSRCGKTVQRFLHPNWTEWEYASRASCMQSRHCLRCGKEEERGPDHIWETKGIVEGTSGYYDEVYYKYETYECIRCGAKKQENR